MASTSHQARLGPAINELLHAERVRLGDPTSTVRVEVEHQFNAADAAADAALLTEAVKEAREKESTPTVAQAKLDGLPN